MGSGHARRERDSAKAFESSAIGSYVSNRLI